MSAIEIVQSESDAIKARLCRQVDSGQRTMGGGTISSDGRGEMWGGDIIWKQANPDGHAAIAYIEKLERRIKMLKADVADHRAEADRLWGPED